LFTVWSSPEIVQNPTVFTHPLPNKNLFFYHGEEVCNNFAALNPRFRKPRLICPTIFCDIFQQTLVRTRAALKLTRVNTVPSRGMLLHHREPEIYLPATNPMFQSAILSSPTAKVTLQCENSLRELAFSRN